MLRVGLTGATGSGKSTVSRMLAERGVVVLDADRVAHELYVPGSPLLDEIAGTFGADVLREDGSLDRGRLGPRVFGNPRALAKLGEIVHPHLLRELEGRLSDLAARGETLAVVEAALLLSWGPPAFIDRVVGVVAGRELRRRRLLAAGLTASQAEARLDAQLAGDELATRADTILVNEGSLDDLDRRVDRLHRELVRRAVTDHRTEGE